jgi:glycosyltransferase involved in cell wall biosynthesis
MTEPKKIGVLLTARPEGGAFQYTQAILEAALALPPDKYSIVLAYRDSFWLDLIRDRARSIRLHDSLWSRVLNRVWHEARLPVSAWRKVAAPLDPSLRALVAERCDLWICPNHDRYSFRARIPALGTVHDLMHRYEPSYSEVSDNGEYAAREFHFSETCRWSRGVLVDSRVGKVQLQESYGVSPEKVFVLPFVAPRYIYDNNGSADAGLVERYSLPPKYFFYPAQFYTHKNHLGLIAALARVREAHADVRLVLVGRKERNGFAEVQQMVRDLGLDDNVLFLGYVPDRDIPGLYRRARALVMPTFFGPTNIPQLEAFAMGCPVATSRIYGIPEQVGDAALLFDPHSVDEIHECMVRLWRDDDLCTTLAERGRRHAREWGPPQFRDRLQEVIDALT